MVDWQEGHGVELGMVVDVSVADPPMLIGRPGPSVSGLSGNRLTLYEGFLGQTRQLPADHQFQPQADKDGTGQTVQPQPRVGVSV